MKAKLILVFIYLFISTLLFSQESIIMGGRIDELLVKIQQLRQDSPAAERQLQQLMAESDFDFTFLSELTKLSGLLKQDTSIDMLRQFIFRMAVRDLHECRQWGNESQAFLPITKTNDQPLNVVEQASIQQVLEDFQVNENVGGCDQEYPAVAVDGSGNFVVVWEDRRNGDPDIYAQRYNNRGELQGYNFRVDDDAGNSWQYLPAIAIDNIGNFVIAWADRRESWLNPNIYAQRFSSSAQFLGQNFQIKDNYYIFTQEYPAITSSGGGNFVVVWNDDRNGNLDIYAQRYDSNGIPQGKNFRVNDDINSSQQYFPSVSADGSGNFVVVWEDERDGNPDIYAQRYNSSGIPQGANFKVNDYSGSARELVPIAIAVDGHCNFIVVWTDARNGTPDIYAQRYSSSGVPQGANFRVNDDNGSSWQVLPAIASDGSGNFVVVWQDDRNGDPDIYAQLFDNQEKIIGCNYRVNSDSSTKDQIYPDVKLVNGHIYYTWQDNRIEGQGYDIFARVDLFPTQTMYIIPIVHDHSLHQEFYVDIQVKDVENLFGAAFKLNFSADKLEALSAEAGDFLGSDVVFFPDINNNSGAVSVGISKKSDQSGSNGTGVIARIKLREKPFVSSGVTINLSLSEVAANDPSGNPLSLTPQDTLYVTPDSTSELTVSTTNVYIGSAANSQGSFVINSNVSWSVSDDATWLTVLPTNGSGNGTITVTATSANSSTNSRSATVTVSGGGITRTVTVIQSGVEPSVAYISPVVHDHSLHQEFYVDIQVKDVQNLFGVAFQFNFPANYLEALSAEQGDFLGTDPIFYPDINNSTGAVSVGISKKSGQAAANGTGIVVRIKLKEKPSVPSGIKIDLSLTEIAANDPSGNAITLTPQNTSYVTPNPTSVDERNKQVPDDYILYPNYPNPFNPTTTISYALPEAAHVQLQIFEINGRLVKRLYDGNQNAGTYSVDWNSIDELNNPVSSGIYLCRLMAGEVILHQKLILAK